VTGRIVLRPAKAEEAGFLSDLALRSKGYWGYDDEFLHNCRQELTISPGQVPGSRIVVALDTDHVVGFAGLEGEPPEGEVGWLFVEPRRIGEGIGALLWGDVCRRARHLGFERLKIESDPGACPFYERMGARRIGQVPSRSIPGRKLPLLEYVLTTM
jgi:GNAT superfamily N-acetyltransferase